MLTIKIPAKEFYNEKTQEFIYIKEQTISLEHSLMSVEKWEARHHKPFLSRAEKTTEEVLDYIECMTITPNVDPMTFRALTAQHVAQIKAYIEDPMTGTILPERKQNGRPETPSAELIYYWMIAFNIPFECRKWHLNHLLTLIQVCEIKNDPKKKKMSMNDIYEKNRSLNEARRKALNTKG